MRCTLSESISKKSQVITLMLSIDTIYQEGYPQCVSFKQTPCCAKLVNRMHKQVANCKVTHVQKFGFYIVISACYYWNLDQSYLQNLVKKLQSAMKILTKYKLNFHRIFPQSGMHRGLLASHGVLVFGSVYFPLYFLFFWTSLSSKTPENQHSWSKNWWSLLVGTFYCFC